MSVEAQESSVIGWFSRLTLFHRLAFLVAVPLAMLGIAAAVNAHKEYINAERAALDQAYTLARQAALRLDQHYDELDKFLTAMAEVARETLTRGEDGDPALTRMIHATPQYITGLSILSLDGRMLASTTTAPALREGINVADRPYFKNALATRRVVVSEPVRSRATDRWVSIAGRPVYDDVGRAIGMVSMSATLERVETILVPSGLPLGALMTVFNERGIGIASTAEPRAAVGRDFAVSDTVKRVLRTRELTAKTVASDGQLRLVSYASAEKLPWLIEVGLDRERVLAPAVEQLRDRLSLLAVALVLGLAAAALIARAIGQPIQTLAHDAEELGKGHLTRRTQASGYREVNQLGAAFNRMAEANQAKREELQDSEARFRSLVILSSDWYWTQDTEHRFTFQSAGRFGEIGLKAADFAGKTRWEMPGAEPLGTTWADHRALLNARQPWRDLIVRYSDRDGQVQYVASSGEPTFGANGEFTGYRGVARLVTDRFRLEEQLRASESKFRALTALSSDWFWEMNTEYRFTSVGFDDPQWEPLLGKTAWEINGEPLGRTWHDFKAMLDRRETFRGAVFRRTNTQGIVAYVSVNGEPVYDNTGAFQGYRGTTTSVTERFRLENELKERIELFRVTFDTAPVAVALVRTSDNEVLLANRATHEMLRIEPGRQRWSVLEYWGNREDARELKRRLEHDGHVRDMEIPVRTDDGGQVWGLLSAQPARYLGEEVTVASLNDITKRKVLEAQSKALELQRETLLTNLRGAHERLRILSRQVLDAQEAERRQIAHELHDEIGQNLTALKLYAEHFRARLSPQMITEADEWIAVLDRAIEQVRDLSRMLRPVQLDFMGLLPALRALLDSQARAAGWSVAFSGDTALPRIDTRLETVAYRVVQEALSNAARHADAASVSLEVKLQAGELRLMLTDDGRGFDVAAARRRVAEGRSLGLLGMEERVRLAGGSFSIDSAPTKGTRIIVSMPLAGEAVPA